MLLPTSCVRDILLQLRGSGIQVGSLFLSLLSDPELVASDALSEITEYLDAILTACRHNVRLSGKTHVWAAATMTDLCTQEINTLTSKAAGMHFDARRATSEKLEEFELVKLAAKMGTLAPHLWHFLGSCLEAEPYLAKDRKDRRRRRRQRQRARKVPTPPRRMEDDAGDSDNELWESIPEPAGIDVAMEIDEAADSDSEDEYWESMEPISSEDLDNLEGEVADCEYEEGDRSARIHGMKQVVCTAILAQSTHQRCNALQSVVGMFLHSCKASESVVEFSSRIGLSISRTAIDDAITNLSRESARRIRDLGRTRLASVAYDNFDVELKTTVPSVDKPHENLAHLTSGTFIRLDHGVTASDLRCSAEVWEHSPNNPKNHGRTKNIDWRRLTNLHPETPHPSHLTRRQRFHKYIFLRDLIAHGPAYFALFASELADPEAVDMIPVVQSQQIPARAMDINQSSVNGNIEALTDLFRQAGWSGGGPDITPSCIDMDEYVVLVHGDLATCERVQSLLFSRGEEKTPFHRFQCVVFILALFHLKMACADAIWKIFIAPKLAREDATSLLQQVAEIRPKETGKITSKPGFRRMHEVVQHVGAVSRLDCWRLEAAAGGFGSLEKWAEAKPSWKELDKMAEVLVKKYVLNENSLETLRHAPEGIRDQQYENTLLKDFYFLLYEELTYAMNMGDIGRVETCFFPWSLIFRGCGKHKYAAQMLRFLYDVHCVYPERLKYAIRRNILCNPTGRKNAFRGVDWWVEHNNLYTKRIYGGRFSTRTKQRILKESPLIEVFKNARISLEDMFALDHRTFKHSPPKLAQTFRKLLQHMKDTRAHEPVPGRKSAYCIPDAIEDGFVKLMAIPLSTDAGVAGSQERDDGDGGIPDEPNGDDGDLDA